MAIITDAAGEGVNRTSDLLDYNEPYTIRFRFYFNANTGAGYQALYTASSGVGVYDEIYIDSSGNLACEVGIGGATTVTGSALTVGNWYDICVVRNSDTALLVYLNGVLDITNTRNVSTRGAIAEMSISNNEYGEWANGRFAAVVAWSTGLVAAEVLNQRYRITPSRIANIYDWWPMFPGATERLRGYHSGRNWTAQGTLTDGAGPPITWGLWTPPQSIYKPPAVVTAGWGVLLSNTRNRLVQT